MKKILAMFMAVALYPCLLHAGVEFGATGGAGPYKYMQFSGNIYFTENMRTLGVEINLAGSREVDAFYSADISYAVFVNDFFRPIAEYTAEKFNNRNNRRLDAGTWYAYNTELTTHSLKLGDELRIQDVKISGYAGFRYSKLEELIGFSYEIIILDIPMVVIDYRETYDLNAGGKVSWKPAQWLEISASGNKRFYFRDPQAALADTMMSGSPGKDRTSVKTSAGLSDYSAGVSIEASIYGIVLSAGYDYAALHAVPMVNYIDYSHIFKIKTGYDFENGTKTGVKFEVVDSHFLDNYRLSGFYLSLFVDFKYEAAAPAVPAKRYDKPYLFADKWMNH